MLAEILTLHADWKSGKIQIDWPPPGVDVANVVPYSTDLEAGSGTTETPTASGLSLTLAEQTVFDRLDSAEVVQAYFSSGDPAVEFYLSAPWLREVTTLPNSVPEREREGGRQAPESRWTVLEIGSGP